MSWSSAAPAPLREHEVRAPKIPPYQDVNTRKESTAQREMANPDRIIIEQTENEDIHGLHPTLSSSSRTSRRGGVALHSMTGSYQQPSVLSMSQSRPPLVLGTSQMSIINPNPTEGDLEHARKDECALMRDNDVLPPKHFGRRESSTGVMHGMGVPSRLARSVSLRGDEHPPVGRGEDGRTVADGSDATPLPGETEPLLAKATNTDTQRQSYGDEASPTTVDAKWEEAVTAGAIQTSARREAKVLARYSQPLIFTFMLQFSLPLASVLTLGHWGAVELGAVSLGTMTANITGYAVYQGLATSLDTLCAQAYGSGHKQLVGLHTQRMVLFLWVITIPIGAVWVSSSAILSRIVPDPRTAHLAGLYVKIVLLGAPGYAAFESGKRFVQAQGLFSATFYVLLIAAPLNAFTHWLFVWHFRWGFVGAPIAVVLTENFMPLALLLYVRFARGGSALACWPGFSPADALRNWSPMVRLALPGLVMVLAEYLAFEVLTLSASRLGTRELAAQSVLATIAAITYQVPFPISIAASTRIANLIGATLVPAAKTAASVAVIAAAAAGALNSVLLFSLRHQIPRLLTGDAEILGLVADVLPVCAAFQLVDAVAASCNGILRGLGRQEVGGWVALGAYYVVAVPLSLGLGFGTGLGLYGLWVGPAVALVLVSVVEGVFILRASWGRSVDDARARNEAA